MGHTVLADGCGRDRAAEGTKEAEASLPLCVRQPAPFIHIYIAREKLNVLRCS